MAATEPVLLDIHLPFSYWRERDFDLGAPTARPDAGLVDRYRRALVAEIESLGEDLGCEGDGPTVGSVFFSGGYLGLLHPDDIIAVLQAVHRALPVEKRLSIGGVLFPGSVDLYAAGTYRNAGFDALLFEVPTFSVRECAAHGWPNVLQALDKSTYVLQAYGLDGFGLRLPADVPDRSAAGWEYAMGQVNHYRPLYVELVGLGAGVRSGSAGDEVAGAPGAEATGSVTWVAGEGAGAGAALLGGMLEAGGYRALASGLYARTGSLPDCLRLHGHFREDGAASRERIGVGCGAVTVLDGYRTRNTDDLGAYLAGMASGDYRCVVTRVEEVGEPRSSDGSDKIG